MKILVINGPNLNLLGLREPELYGGQNYETLLDMIRAHCKARRIEVDFYQSNHEGALVDALQAAYGAYDGLVINPAAYTHTSIALLDALKAISLPAVEVHITDIRSREAFRQISYIGTACIATICGHGLDGYIEAINLLEEYLQSK